MNLRIEQIFREEMKGDTSFQEKENGLSLFGTKYSKHEMRETWDRGIKYGIEIGLRKASLEGQIIELNHNTTNEKHKEFLEKFYQLSADYNCAIQYYPKFGMVVIESQLNNTEEVKAEEIKKFIDKDELLKFFKIKNS